MTRLITPVTELGEIGKSNIYDFSWQKTCGMADVMGNFDVSIDIENKIINVINCDTGITAKGKINFL